jgi:3-oxoacyl-[acyl-carrier protein] reductase
MADSRLIGSQNTQSIKNQITVNLISSVLTVEHFGPQMFANRFGRIILFGSIVARDGGVGVSTYAACKAGLIGLMKSAVKEMPHHKRKSGIDSNFTINLVSPGYTETPMTTKLPEKVKDAILFRTPTSRFVQPNEISRLVAYLISDEASSINGAELEINGGSFL